MLVIGPEDAVRSGLTNLSVKPMANGKLAVIYAEGDIVPSESKMLEITGSMAKAPVPKDVMRTSKLMDGVVWDGKDPKKYADSFKVRA